jgi:Asp-tRNA(Asn)/Glu-tRNA(Gln) amidotransferase A subunit family amidase
MAPFDAVVLPTTACASFPQRERHPQNTADLTAIASATGLPAVSLPLPHPASEMPVGLQLIGQMGTDRELLRIGAELENRLSAAAAR